MATLRVIDVDACTLALGRADAVLHLLTEFYSDESGPLLPALDTAGRELAELERLLTDGDGQPAHDHHGAQPEPGSVFDLRDGEAALLKVYRQLSPEQRVVLLTVARTMAGERHA